MSLDRVIAEVAVQYRNFKLEDAQDEPTSDQANYCNYAVVFEQWAADTLRDYLHQERDAGRIAQAKVRLIDRYFEWRAQVPKSHRNRTGESGHICIFHIFERAYQQIKMMELTLPPPAIIVQPPPSQPRALAEVPAIYIGEVMGPEE